jgi:hypothetical protein
MAISRNIHLLCINLVCLVENYAYFVIMPTERPNHTLELIADVKLMWIKQEKNKITLAALCSLLFP